jgi:hypothetical protein
MSHRIFVSYSHHDAVLVTPVVRLLRATRDLVFLDADSIRPGTRWRAGIADALREASLVVVFWCRHSHESAEVKTEYRTAVRARKDVLPVLLDSTELPPDLTEFQWIDFRELARERHEEAPAHPAAASPARAARPRRTVALLAIAAMLALVTVTSFLTLRSTGPAPAPPATTAPGTGAPDGPPAEPRAPLPASQAWPRYVPLVIVAALVVAGLMAWRANRRARVRRPSAPAAAANAAERTMSDTLGAEIQRRLGSHLT